MFANRTPAPVIQGEKLREISTPNSLIDKHLTPIKGLLKTIKKRVIKMLVSTRQMEVQELNSVKGICHAVDTKIFLTIKLTL